MKTKIIFERLDIDGKHQKEWFQIFDLLDKIFTDKEKESMVIKWNYCIIHNFNFKKKDLPKGTSKRAFCDFVLGL